ncbi:MAG: TonB-dependent receptor, partial [Salinivirgaceae bacterium]|nr:TonB-dependent receptor [Salinivirgaceae bacterium]
MKRLVTAIMATVFSAQIANAQQTINGRIADGNNEPVAFANVVLMTADSAYISGAVSDIDGRFAIEQKQGAQIMSISCIGYERFCKQISEIQDFGNIVVETQSTELDEVTVKAIAPKTKLKDGAMVTTVEGTTLSRTGSTMRMLSNVPGLIKRNGGIEVIGRGQPEYYINNRKVRDLNELETLSPDNIKNVEVISSPGARYDATVTAVVRITTIAPTGDGFGFSLESSFGQGFRDYTRCYQEKANFNYRKNGFDLFANFRADINQKTGNRMDIYTLNNSDHRWETDNSIKGTQKNQILPATIGLNYQINEQNSIGAQFTYKTVMNEKTNAQNTLDVMCDGQFFDHILTQSEEKRTHDFENDLNAYYNGKVGGFNIDLNVDFVYNPTDKESVTPEESDNYDDRNIVTTNSVQNKLAAQKLVVGHELWGGRIDVGAEATFTNRTDETKSNIEEFVPSVSSEARQKTIAGFAEYKRTFAGKYNLTAGLRYEHLNLDFYNNGQLDSEASTVYSELFPSVTFSGVFGKMIQLQFAYNEKISRPSYFSMSNNVTYASRYLQQKGNPTLKPTIIRSAELTATLVVLQLKAIYTHNKNHYIQYQVVNEEHPESEVLHWINLDKPTLNLQFATQLPLGIYKPTVAYFV